MNRKPTAVVALVTLACLLATTVQSEPIEAMVAADAWSSPAWLTPAANPAAATP